MIRGFRKRLASIEADVKKVGCPHCEAVRGLTEAMLDANLKRLLSNLDSGQDDDAPYPLPAPSPNCQVCHKYDGWSEAALDSRLAELLNVLDLADSYEHDIQP